MSPDEIECRNFAILIWTAILTDELVPDRNEADQMIILAASYGPPKNSTTHTD